MQLPLNILFMSQSNTSQFTLAPKEAYRLFEKAADLADILEDIMEAHGSYSKEFLKGLSLSQKQTQTGKIKKINSLKELR